VIAGCLDEDMSIEMIMRITQLPKEQIQQVIEEIERMEKKKR